MNNLNIRFRDDGKEWSEQRSVTIGFKTLRGHIAELHRNGIYHSRQYEISCESDGPIVVVGAEEDIEVLR